MPGTRIRLDRDVEFTPGEDYTFSYVTPAGVLQTIAIANPATTTRTIETTTEITEADQPLPNSIWGISSAAALPRKFRIMQVKEARDGKVDVAALEYRPEKYSAIDNGVLIPDADGTFTDLISPGDIEPPGIPTLSFITRDTPTGRRGVVLVTSTPSTSRLISGYRMTYQFGFNNFVVAPESQQPNFEIPDPPIDVVRVVIQSRSIYGTLSAPVSADLDLRTGGAAGKELISNIRIKGIGGTEWTGRDIHIEWDANSPYSDTTGRNDGVDPFFKRFRVQVKNPTGGAVVTTLYSPIPEVTIPYELLTGTLLRSYQIGVSVEDVNDVFSTETNQTVSNPAPGLTGVTVTEGTGTAAFAFGDSNDADFRGIILYVSDVDGFTPGPANEVWRGLGGFIYNGPPGVTRYYRYAAYDAFGDTGLTVSSQGTFDIGLIVVEDLDFTAFASSIQPVGIAPTALPSPTGYTGPTLVYLVPEDRIYRYVSGAWTPAINGGDVTPGSIGSSQLGANSVIAGKIAAAAISATEIASDAITADKIAANAVTADKILANAVTAGKIAAGSITADRMNVTQLSAIVADLGSITAGSLNIGSGKFVVDSSGNVTIQSGASGQRVEISNALIKVYDSSNVLRVELGIY